MTKTLVLRTDGASRGNPGLAAIGVVIEDENGLPLRTFHRFIGKTTNNEAEYHALIDGLKAIRDWRPDRLVVFLDSKLVVEQVNGRYRVKSQELKPLHDRVMEMIRELGPVEVKHVERDQNKMADKLANMALDAHGKG